MNLVDSLSYSDAFIVCRTLTLALSLQTGQFGGRSTPLVTVPQIPDPFLGSTRSLHIPLTEVHALLLTVSSFRCGCH